MNKSNLEKTFYLIAKYHLGTLEGFIKIGDNKEEIIKLFQERYCWKNNTFGITEESHQLLEVNAKEIMNDRYYLDREIKQMTIPKQLLEAKICNKDNCKIIQELEEWLRDDEIKIYKLGTRQRGKTLEFGALLYRDMVLDKLNELKEKYK